MAGSITVHYSAGMSEPTFDPKRAAIWDLHLAAAELYRNGNKPAAWLIAEFADAAERVWLQCSGDNRSGSP